MPLIFKNDFGHMDARVNRENSRIAFQFVLQLKTFKLEGLKIKYKKM